MGGVTGSTSPHRCIGANVFDFSCQEWWSVVLPGGGPSVRYIRLYASTSSGIALHVNGAAEQSSPIALHVNGAAVLQSPTVVVQWHPEYSACQRLTWALQDDAGQVS